MCVCVCVCVRACVRACVRVCVCGGGGGLTILLFCFEVFQWMRVRVVCVGNDKAGWLVFIMSFRAKVSAGNY